MPTHAIRHDIELRNTRKALEARKTLDPKDYDRLDNDSKLLFTEYMDWGSLDGVIGGIISTGQVLPLRGLWQILKCRMLSCLAAGRATP